jgi:hypothetical protein
VPSCERRSHNRPQRCSAIDALKLALCELDRPLEILAAGGVARKHVDQHETGNGRSCLIADRIEPAERQRALRKISLYDVKIEADSAA